jgi:transposase
MDLGDAVADELYYVRQITHNIKKGIVTDERVMPKRITIKPHLSIEELEMRYRRAKDSVERTHYQIIWLLAKGLRTEEVVTTTGYSRSWIYELVWGYNRIGAETLGDHRHQNRGSGESLLSEIEIAYLWQVMQEPPFEGGLWNGRKVADWISQLIGRPVSRQRGWEYLKQMEYRLRVPRPEHTESSLSEQQEWKKKSVNSGRTNPKYESRLRRRSLGNGRTSNRTKTSNSSYLG